MSEETVQKILEEVDNYEQAINASLSFIHIYKWDEENERPNEKVRYWLGKSYSNGENDVTPDITIQLNGLRGIVVELKPKLPKDMNFWEKKFKQLKKYDTKLIGWVTDNHIIPQQELVLLTDQKLVKRIIAYIRENKLTFQDYSKNFCIVQYGPATGNKAAYYLRKEYGKIDDFNHVTDQRWEIDGFTIDIENHLIKTGLIKIKLIDYKPPTVYLMSLLWDYVFSSMIGEEGWRNAKIESGRKIVEIPVNISDLRKILQEKYSDPNAKHGIKEEWIKEALENFVKLKLAKRVKGNDKEYIIKFRKKIEGEREGINKNQLFAELLYKSGAQTTLGEFNKKEDEN